MLTGLTIDSFGNDSITATTLSDSITGGTGADELAGEVDQTYLCLCTNCSCWIADRDKITDFDATNDRIDLQVTPVIPTASSQSMTLGGSFGTVTLSSQGKATFPGNDVGDATLTEILSAVRSVVDGVK